jgi:hypothetical protein
VVGTTNFPGGLDSHASGSPAGFAAVVDNLQTRLTAELSATATTINVTSNVGFVVPGIIVVGTGMPADPGEPIYVTGTSGTTGFTGGVRGAGAQVHVSGATVTSAPVAANHNDVAAAVAQIEIAVQAGRNLIVNPCGLIDQRVGPYTTAGSRNNDATYTLDHWIVISDGNNIVDVAQDTTVANIPTGCPSAIKLTVTTANKKAGIVQLLPAYIAREIIGGTASLRWKARTETSHVINNHKAALLSWAGTSDAPTKDVVSGASWGAAGTDPTWATSYTNELTMAVQALSTSWGTYGLPAIAVDTASAKNVAIVFWIDDTDAAIGDILYITDISLVKGAATQPIVYRSPSSELYECQEWLYVYGSGEASTYSYLGNAKSGSTVYAEVSYLPRNMRTAPTVGAGPASSAGAVYIASTGNNGTVTINNLGLRTFRPVNLGSAWTVDAQISLSASFSAELGV